MPTDIESRARARGILVELDDERLVLALPGTEYRLHLRPTVSGAEITTPPGKRISGTIRATALRMYPARAGGRFIEPIWGEPRIVQGTVLAVDAGRVLVDVSVPMWVTLKEGQDVSGLAEGQMVNFYVRSGASFRPIERWKET